METINIRMTKEEKLFAREQSKKYPGCPRPNEGSVAHYIKWIIHQHAKKIGKQLRTSYNR